MNDMLCKLCIHVVENAQTLYSPNAKNSFNTVLSGGHAVVSFCRSNPETYHKSNGAEEIIAFENIGKRTRSVNRNVVEGVTLFARNSTSDLNSQVNITTQIYHSIQRSPKISKLWRNRC